MARAGNNHKGGRPRGSKSPKTLEKERIQRALNERIFRGADKLYNSLAIAAIGTHRMVVVEKDDEGKTHITTIRDEKRMQKLLDTGKYGKDYMILAGAEPDWRASNAALDRAFGKAKESVEMDVTGQVSLYDLKKRRDALLDDDE